MPKVPRDAHAFSAHEGYRREFGFGHASHGRLQEELRWRMANGDIELKKPLLHEDERLSQKINGRS